MLKYSYFGEKKQCLEKKFSHVGADCLVWKIRIEDLGIEYNTSNHDHTIHL